MHNAPEILAKCIVSENAAQGDTCSSGGSCSNKDACSSSGSCSSKDACSSGGSCSTKDACSNSGFYSNKDACSSGGSCSIADFLAASRLPKKEARECLKHVLNLSDSFILAHSADYFIQEKALIKLRDMEKNRLSGLPLAYVLEKRYFYRNEFYCPCGVLIPQPDTEILVENAVFAGKKYGQGFTDNISAPNCTALPETEKISFGNTEKSESDSFAILDLCSGTGCIGISVAEELAPFFKEIHLVLADIDKTANKASEINARNILKKYKNIKTEIINSDLFSDISASFDLLLTNPPYIKTSEIATLDNEVKAEPLLALDGGEDGLFLIKKIIENAKEHLNAHGSIFIEIGCTQGAEVWELLKRNSFQNIKIIKDLSGLDRVLKANI